LHKSFVQYKNRLKNTATQKYSLKLSFSFKHFNKNQRQNLAEKFHRITPQKSFLLGFCGLWCQAFLQFVEKMDEQETSINGVVDENATEKRENLDTVPDFRFYEHEFPEKEDLVMTRIERLEEFCAFVSLLEYNNLEATIQFSELSTTRLRKNPASIVPVGKFEVLQVLKVDEEKGYVDLTRKNIKPEEVEQCRRRYAKGKTLQSILKHVVQEVNDPNITLEYLYKNIVWNIVKTEKYEFPVDAFEEAVNTPSVLDPFLVDISEPVKKLLLKDIKHRLATQQVKVQATFELTCFTHEGIDAIIPSLKAGQDLANQLDKDHPTKVNLISTPLYTIATTTMDKEKGMEVINKAVETIKAEIEKRNGSLVVKIPASVVTATS
jgi:translation initiation factor 2 subunit 1